MSNIQKVDVRNKLTPRREPYWRKLGNGRHLGFRIMPTKDTEKLEKAKRKRAGSGSWLARFRDVGGYHQQPIDGIDILPANQQFDAAKTQAEAWFAHLVQGGSTNEVTVRQTCEGYVEYLRNPEQRKKRPASESAAKSAENTFKRFVFDDPVARIELSKLKERDVEAWCGRLRSTSGNGSASYFNRVKTALRAALNLAFKRHHVSSPLAWKNALEPQPVDDDEVAQRTYLTREERVKIFKHAPEELKPSVRAWSLLPVRPGEIERCKVANLDQDNHVLGIPRGKVKPRETPLDPQAFAHLTACAADKLPGAWLLTRADGSQWNRDAWSKALKKAVASAKLPHKIVALDFRHSVITDLVNESGLTSFEVAELAGTSVAMIEKHYYKRNSKRMRAGLENFSRLYRWGATA